MKNTPDVSIITVNYNTSRLVADCLKSIKRETKGLNYEVIIVDNNSEPDFKFQILSKAGLSDNDQYKFISLAENKGFGQANNEALKVASGRNILFLNPDTKLINNAVKILSDFLDCHSLAGACCGNLFNKEGNPIFSYSRLLPGPLREFDEMLNNLPQKLIWGYNKNHNHTEKPIEPGFLSGADLMVKKRILEEIGGFSDDFFMFYEDTDLCFKILRSGWKLYNVPQAKIIHLSSKSFNETNEWKSDLKTRLMEEGRNIYYKKNRGKNAIKISNFFYNIFLTTRVIFIREKGKKEYYRLRKAYFKSSR